MAAHSSILARRIPWTEDPGGCSPWGHRIGHDWAHSHSLGRQSNVFGFQYAV